MKALCKNLKGFFLRDWTLAEKILVVLCCIMIGIVKGFFLAPVKGGIRCGNHTVYNQKEDEYWLDDED